jgi:hypothetical protein
LANFTVQASSSQKKATHTGLSTEINRTKNHGLEKGSKVINFLCLRCKQASQNEDLTTAAGIFLRRWETWDFGFLWTAKAATLPDDLYIPDDTRIELLAYGCHLTTQP